MNYLKRITHCTFTCKDYPAMLHFYGEILGLEPVFKLNYNESILNAYKNHGYAEAAPLMVGDEWITYYRISSREYIELFNLPYTGENEIRNEGFHHIALSVKDIVEAARHLEAQGIPIYPGPIWCHEPYQTPYPDMPETDNTNSYSFFIQDPEKNMIQIIQYTDGSLQLKNQSHKQCATDM